MKFTFAPEARPLDGYTIKRAIHRGGFGEVYYALSDAGKEVALKLLNNNMDVELRGVAQCLNLKHNNLVTIFDIRQDTDDDHWVVMEYVSGRGLYETLRDHPNGMPVEEVLFWLRGMCGGLSFLHDRGIVHRDLKPANVFRDHEGVKIGDVGLSKYISESRRSAQTQSVGTVYYMAPEVAKGRYGREVDMYALGIMLYEMITGHVPFDGQTTAEILMKHLTSDPDLTVLPDNLQPVIGAALKKNPDERISSPEELEELFSRAVKGIDVKAPVPLNHSVAPPAAAMDSTKPINHEAATKVGDTANSKEAEQPAPAFKGPAEKVIGRDTDLSAIVAFWNAIPAPLQWVIGGAAALFIIESGLLKNVAIGGLIGGIAYLIYQILKPFLSNKEADGQQEQRKKKAETTAFKNQVSPMLEPAAMAAVMAETIAPKARKSKPRRKRPQHLTPLTLRKISKRQRATDISTSVSMSLIASALVTVAVFFTTNLLNNYTQAVYFAAVTMLASWSLIVPSKIWEGRPGDNFSRRLCLCCMGLGIGFLAATMSQYLLIDSTSLFQGKFHSKPLTVGRVTISDGSGFPTVACYMLFFGALFAIRRWWWQVDSFRKSRFRVSSALFTLLVGVVIAGILDEYSFPDSLGATWALAISAVVQLSAGWTPTEERIRATTDFQEDSLRQTRPVRPPEIAVSQAAPMNQA